MTQEIYTTNSEAFRVYLKYVDQKSVLTEHIQKKLSPIIEEGQKFVFTDIGGGEGSTTRSIMDFLCQKTDLEVNYIDNSKELAKIFQEKNSYKKTNVVISDIKNVSLPESDFILIAHVLKYVDKPNEIVRKAVEALKPKGVVLIVDTNEESDDIQLRTTLNIPPVGGNIGEMITGKLETKNVLFEHEIVESHIDFSKTLKPSNEGEALISFFYHKKFEDISENQVKKFQQALEQLSPTGIITKREDYFWIYSSKPQTA